MHRVQNIYDHPDFQYALRQNKSAEQDRIFCHHEMSHFLTVGRLGYIFALERNYTLRKDMIYAAALLHDIGRWKQYADGTPHDRASAIIAEPILQDAGYSESERHRILSAILDHRKGAEKDELAEVLYDADKASRDCYLCDASGECNWSKEKKNLQIIW